MNTNTTELGIEIKNRRTALSLTQDDLARSSRINIRTIQRAEKGIKIGSFTLRRILEALNLDVLSTLKRFRIEEKAKSENNATLAPKEFNPDRWMAEFQLRKAKHTLWGVEIKEEIEQIIVQSGQLDNDMPTELMDARLEELYCASEVHSEEANELANEEDAIHSFDWDSWEFQKEMQALEKEREAEEREISREMEHFEYIETPSA